MMLSILLLALSPAAAPQQEAVLSPDQVAISTYKPRNLDLQELFSTIKQLAGRNLVIEDRFVENIALLYDRLMIYDTKEETARILGMLQTLEAAFQDSADAQRPPRIADFPAREYRLRALSTSAALDLLFPYRRDVDVSQDGTSWTQFSTITEVNGSVLMLRDVQENLNAMVQLLDKMDVPAPQVMVRAWVLRSDASGVDAPPPPPLPPALQKNLQELLPGYALAADAQGALRAAADNRNGIELAMAGRSGRSYILNLSMSAYDPAGSTLTLGDCRLLADGELIFQTGTTISAEEFAVIGISGGDPVLLVLQLQPIRR